MLAGYRNDGCDISPRKYNSQNADEIDYVVFFVMGTFSFPQIRVGDNFIIQTELIKYRFLFGYMV